MAGPCQLHAVVRPQRGAVGNATGAPRRASDYCERAQASATMAPPRHMPVPTRCTISTARMVARVGRASMLQRL